jgi:arginyl-tRNA synthetase
MFERKVEERLSSLIKQSLQDIFPLSPPIKQQKIILEIPRDKSHGQLATPVAMRLSPILKKPPLEIANLIKEELFSKIGRAPLLSQNIEKIEVAAPGFINFFFKKSYFYQILTEILKTKEKFGQLNIGKNKKVQLEFVSANPTGPLSVAHARQAAVGDTLANILEFLGYKVSREYYINDEGNQINILGKSIEARYNELLGEATPFPEEGYQGDYIYDIAREIIKKSKAKDTQGAKLNKTKFFADYGVSFILKTIKKDLKDFGVNFDNWFSQRSLTKTDKINKALGQLRKKGFIYDQDGAVWFKSTLFGDDKYRVVIKSDKSFTYLAPDIAYHKDKYTRGFKWLINIWGPDHHGYIPRLKAAVQALGEKEDSLSVIIVQLATLFKEGKPIQMSTRRAQYISLREVLDEVGRDAARYFFLLRKTSSHLDFDLELAKKQTPDNPVYYIQYAYARISSIFKNIKSSKKPQRIDFSLLNSEEEMDLLKILSNFPKTLEICAEQLDPYSLADYLLNLAASFHKFYDLHRVLGEDQALTQARLGLICATKIIIAAGLTILGVSRPKKM